MSVIADLTERLTLKDFGATAQRVRATLAKDGAIRGVVLPGGLDVVPSRQIDTLPENLRHALRPSDDPYDNFVVWCDDEYGARGLAIMCLRREDPGARQSVTADELPQFVAMRCKGLRGFHGRFSVLRFSS
jgi:hypothetical protein